MSRGRLVLGIVAVACAAAAVFFATRPSTAARAADRPPSAEGDRDSDRMQRQLDQLAAEVRRLRSRPPASDDPSGGAAGATEAPEEAARRAEEAGPPREEVVRNALERQVAGEERDAGWATGTEQAIHAVLATEAFTGTAIVGAECRTTVCRVHVVHDGEEAKDTFASEIAGTPPFDTEGVLWNAGTEEAPETVLFVAREGDALAIPR